MSHRYSQDNLELFLRYVPIVDLVQVLSVSKTARFAAGKMIRQNVNAVLKRWVGPNGDSVRFLKLLEVSFTIETLILLLLTLSRSILP